MAETMQIQENSEDQMSSTVSSLPSKKKGGGGGAIGNREYATPSTPFQFKKIAKGKKNDGTFGGCAT